MDNSLGKLLFYSTGDTEAKMFPRSEWALECEGLGEGPFSHVIAGNDQQNWRGFAYQ